MARLQIDSPGAFFPPLQEGDETPEFLRWAIGFSCGSRDACNGGDLDRLFRQLRPLAAAGLALAEGRIQGGACIAECRGHRRYQFELAEVLPFYGAASAADVACRQCPLQDETAPFPQCLGWVSIDGHWDALCEALEAAANELGAAAACLPSTAPRWYGLWAESPLAGERLAAATMLLEGALRRLPGAVRPLEELLLGMRRAGNQNRPFFAAMTPAGVIRSGRWLLPGRCGYCGVPRAPRQRLCKVCGHSDQWRSSEKRHLLGIRPYRRSSDGDAI